MAQLTLTPTEKSALLQLLDDPNVQVHAGLSRRFTELGAVARDLLRDTANGPNRHLAWHAKNFLNELRFGDPRAEFLEFIQSLDHELESGVLLLARTVRPDLDTGSCGEELDGIARRCREIIIEPSSTRAKCRIINRIIYHEMGFSGNVDHYTDPDNSLLDQVLRHRRGIPISLCTLYLLVAHRLGIDLEPIGLPGHFMIGCFTEDRPFFIDAFVGGIFRSPEEIFVFLRSHHLSPRLSDLAPTPVREVLCRSCRNLANHYESHGDTDRAAMFDSFVIQFEATCTRNMT